MKQIAYNIRLFTPGEVITLPLVQYTDNILAYYDSYTDSYCNADGFLLPYPKQ